MKTAFSLCVLLPAIFAQSSTTEYTHDLNGNLVPVERTVDTKSNGAASQTQMEPSINGGSVPREKVDEKILQNGPNHKIIERTVRPYDATGDPGQPEKILIDEETRPDGSSTTKTTVYRGDINGTMQITQRSTTESHKQGSDVNATTVVERPSLSGEFTPVERRQSVEQSNTGGMHQSVEIYRVNANGQFYEAAREVTDREKKDGVVTANTAVYSVGLDGQMQFASQNVQKTTKNPDGSERVEVDIFAKNVPGTVGESGAKPELKAQQIVERRKGAGNTVIETLSERRPSINDPAHLGSPEKISETICTGKCGGSDPQP
ncbi:MAG: hypothetical protein ABI165_19210 [Bryobacteraceae bacterium]